MSEKLKSGTFVKQAAILVGASIIVRIMGFVYRLPLTDMIGDAGNGIYGKAYYIYNFFFIVSSAGMPAAISKLVAERVSLGRCDEAHRVFRIALMIAIVSGLVCSLILFFGAESLTNTLNSPRSFLSLRMLSPTVFIVAIMAVFRGYFQGLGTTLPTSISQVVEQLFNAVFSVVLAYYFMKIVSDDVDAMGAAGGTAGTGVGALFGLLTVLAFYAILKPVIFRNIRKVKEKRRLRSQASLFIGYDILRTAIPIIAGTAVFSFSNIIDLTMVTERLIYGGFTPEMADVLYGQLNGKYTTIITLPVSVAAAIATASIPSISSSNVLNDIEGVKNKVETGFRLTMLICVPAAIGIGVLGDQIVQMLFPNHVGGGILLRVGAINIIFIALNQILTGPLQAMGYVYVPVIAALAGSVVKITMNYFLVANPEINVVGAVISTFFCYIVASAINWFMFRRNTGVRLDFMRNFIKPLISAIIMGACCYVVYYVVNLIVDSNTVSTMIAIILGFVVYLIFMFFTRGINRQDILLMPYGKKMLAFLERFGFM